MPVKTTEKLNIIFKPDKFIDIVSKLDDLTRISDTLKLKIDSEDILIYSIMGTENMVMAFKGYTLKTSDYINIESIDYTLNIIITSAKKFVKNLAFIKTTEKILMEVNHRPDDSGDSSDTRLAIIKNAKFKIQIQTGENSEIRDLNKTMLSQRMNLKNKLWSFKTSNSDFSDVKKLSSINSDDSRKVLHLDIKDKKVVLSEVSLWELEVDEVEEENKHLIFNKGYLSSINDNGGDIHFHVFETFILIKDEISNLMISFETTFD